MSRRFRAIFDTKSKLTPSTSAQSSQSFEPNIPQAADKEVTVSPPTSPTTHSLRSSKSAMSSPDAQHSKSSRRPSSSGLGYVLKVPVAPGYCF
ncbi:hypothetical protein L208DRAFT_1413954 [Tricholoma matsutake]|nr:hypothetical protein L208DRAFT_1413954 [Tricholoma matsutake 945]